MLSAHLFRGQIDHWVLTGRDGMLERIRVNLLSPVATVKEPEARA